MHTGSIDGMSAIIGLMPDRRVGVYVLANLDHAELRHALMYQVFDLYTGAAPRDWSAELRALFESTRGRPAASAMGQAQPAPAVPSLPLERYVGTYADSTFGEVVVSLVDGALSARFGSREFGRLDVGPYDTFRPHTPSPALGAAPLTFVPDGAGSVASLRVFGVTFARIRTK
jgi:hypothetical protein